MNNIPSLFLGVQVFLLIIFGIYLIRMRNIGIRKHSRMTALEIDLEAERRRTKDFNVQVMVLKGREVGYERSLKTYEEKISNSEQRIQELRRENVQLNAKLWNTIRESRSLTNEIDKLSAEIEVIRHQTHSLLRDKWIQEICQASFRNEVEVEIMFVYPLLRFLDFSPVQHLEVRVPVTFQVGRNNNIRVEADWIVWNDMNAVDRQALFVIEAKSPSTFLTEEVRLQARSYAIAISAELYMLTNGREVKVYKRGVRYDECKLECSVADLSVSWCGIEELLHRSNLL